MKLETEPRQLRRTQQFHTALALYELMRDFATPKFLHSVIVENLESDSWVWEFDTENDCMVGAAVVWQIEDPLDIVDGKTVQQNPEGRYIYCPLCFIDERYRWKGGGVSKRKDPHDSVSPIDEETPPSPPKEEEEEKNSSSLIGSEPCGAEVLKTLIIQAWMKYPGADRLAYRRYAFPRYRVGKRRRQLPDRDSKRLHYLKRPEFR